MPGSVRISLVLQANIRTAFRSKALQYTLIYFPNHSMTKVTVFWAMTQCGFVNGLDVSEKLLLLSSE